MDDDLTLPDFLRRSLTMTPDEQERQRRRMLRITAEYRDRKIKNPPKRVRKSTRQLGAPIGYRVRES